MARVFIVLILAGVIPTQVAPAEERILVANLLGHTAELVDPINLRTLATTPVGQQPMTVAVTPDRRFGLVASQGFFAGPLSNGSVAVLDLTASGMPVLTSLSVKTQPFGLAVAPDGKTAVVTRVNQQYQAELLLLDMTTSPPSELGKPVLIPKAQAAYNVAITPDGKTALTVDGRQLIVVDLTQSPPVVTNYLKTNADAFFLRLSNDGRRLIVVSKHNPSKAGVWSLESLPPTKTGDVVIGGNSAGATPGFDPGNLFGVVANSGSRILHVIDAHALPPVQLGTVDSMGKTQRGLTVMPDGKRAWAAARGDTRLVEVNVSNPSKPVRTGRTHTVRGNGPENIVAFGEVHAHGIPAPGSSYPVFLTSPVDAGKSYIMGASFGTKPGIPVGSRTVPLAPDTLFFTSLTTPSVFQDFSGVLNSNGRAVATLHIPALPGLQGLSLYVAGVIVDPHAPMGIRVVTNAEHIVIQ